jgi:hypothetical protein
MNLASEPLETLFQITYFLAPVPARYYLFVPWIYKDVERRLARNKLSIAAFTREVETREKNLIRALMAGGEKDGVIGIEAKEKLQRLPSNIYWSGLHAFKIRLTEGSQSQYARHISIPVRAPHQLLPQNS